MFKRTLSHSYYTSLSRQHSSKTRQKQIRGLALHLIFHGFSPFNCCLNVVLQLGKVDYPKNLNVAFCPNKQRSFLLFKNKNIFYFMCLDLVVEWEYNGTSSYHQYRPTIAQEYICFKKYFVQTKQDQTVCNIQVAHLSL